MSVALDMGWWVATNGQRKLLTYWADTGALVLGDQDVIAIIYDEDDLRRRLTGWAEHCETREGLSWIAAQLEGCR